jgi:hypothetical protein
MQTLTLIIAVLALVIAVAAFYRTGGIKNLRQQMDRISTKTEGAAKSTREVAADTLGRVEQLIRGKEKAPKVPPEATAGVKDKERRPEKLS